MLSLQRIQDPLTHCSVTLLRHALQTCPFPSIQPDETEKKDSLPNLLPARQAQDPVEALSAAEPTPLPSPCPAAPGLFGLFCFVAFYFFFPSDGVKVRPTRHFIAVPDENSPGDSRGARSGVTEAGVTRLASQAVPVLGGPGWPGDSSGTGRALPAAVAARTARPERARESDE